jgi:hypothetical protein
MHGRVKQVTTVRKRAMRQVREFVIKHTVGTAEATGKGIPIKRHQTYQYVMAGHGLLGLRVIEFWSSKKGTIRVLGVLKKRLASASQPCSRGWQKVMCAAVAAASGAAS